MTVQFSLKATECFKI